VLEIKGIRFDVEIRRKKIKNLYLRLEGNKVVASAPLRMPEYQIYRFIEQKKDWIYKVYDYNVYKSRVTRLYKGGDTFYLFDQPYRLVRSTGKKKVAVVDDTIYLVYPDDGEAGIKYLYHYLDKYLLERAEQFLNKYLYFLEDYGYDLIPDLKCRIMTSKWGVCYTRKNLICISSYLVHYPLKCLEYIMIHEMTHFLIPNHSKRFYDIIRSKMPDYKEVVATLKL
jgi:predicted metal-dependent hydrolase